MDSVAEVSKVTQVNSLRAKRDSCQSKVERLRRQSRELNQAFQFLSRASGSYDAVAEDRRAVNSALKSAEEELRAAEGILTVEAERERIPQFKAAIERTRQARSEVIEHMRQASLALADFHAACKEAVDLANQAATPNGVGTCWPHEVAALREVNDPHIDPYHDKWMDDKSYVVIDLSNCPRIMPVRKL